MIVYHGTARYSLEGLLTSLPRTAPRSYLKGRQAFSTTTDFNVAALFALRRSPPSVLSGDEREMGVVVEYEVQWISREGKDWVEAVQPGVLQDEKEIAIFKPKVLDLQGVWFVEEGDWKRRHMGELADKRPPLVTRSEKPSS